MIYGDIVTITRDGILLYEKALQPLGIYDKSICWAVWVANPYDGPQVHYPNLVISPIHPKSWPFLIQIEIALRDHEGALAWLCKQLRDRSFSILFLECTTAGFSHAFCNVIIESTKESIQRLQEKKEAFDSNHPYVRVSQESFLEAQQIANLIAAEMFIEAKRLEEEFNLLLEQKGQIPGTEKEHFLHSWDVEKKSGRFLYDEEAVLKKMDEVVSSRDQNANAAYLKRISPKTITAHYMQRLAYFSVYGGGVDVPFSLRYNSNSALLKLEKDEIFQPEGANIYEEPEKPFPLGEFPVSAISIFNGEEKYLRLKPITARIMRHDLTQINVTYRIETREGVAEASRGLIYEITKKLYETDVNLLHVANNSTRYEYSIKAGLISFVADVPKRTYGSIEEAIKSINLNKPNNLKYVQIRDVSVEEYPQRRLFVSLHFGHPRHNDIIKIIHENARRLGFEEIIVETYVAPATQTIIEKVSACQAFLQLLLFRGDDNPQTLSFSWLDFEYGVASGKGIPSIRLVDTTRLSPDWWKIKITTNTDQRVREFRSDADEEELTRTIRSAVQELAQELLRRQQEVG